MHLLPPLDPGDKTPRIFLLMFPLESMWRVYMETYSLGSPLQPEDAEKVVQIPGDRP